MSFSIKIYNCYNRILLLEWVILTAKYLPKGIKKVSLLVDWIFIISIDLSFILNLNTLKNVVLRKIKLSVPWKLLHHAHVPYSTGTMGMHRAPKTSSRHPPEARKPKDIFCDENSHLQLIFLNILTCNSKRTTTTTCLVPYASHQTING